MSYFLNTDEIVQTIRMIEQEHLDVRTITLGLSLLDCATGDIKRTADKVYEKICREAHDLVPVGEAIEREFGIPIVNKRVSVTPVALIAGGCGDDLVPIAEAMDRAAREVGVNYIGGFSALVQKGFTAGDRSLIASIPEALARTERVCASVNVGSTKAGIDMDAVALMGRTIKELADTLRDYGAEEMFLRSRGSLRVRMDLADSDFQAFMSGDEDAICQFQGVFMQQYSWAEPMVCTLQEKKELMLARMGKHRM